MVMCSVETCMKGDFLFTMDLEMVCTPLYRLQKDDSWRALKGDITPRETDFTAHSPSKMMAIPVPRGKMAFDGKTYKVNASSFSMAETPSLLFGAYRIFRHAFPKEPSRDQLEQVIASGDDSRSNVLVLNIYGDFELREFVHDLDRDPSIVVRHECFAAGNGYVGYRASRSTNLIDHHYESSMDHWVAHLLSHRLGTFSGETSPEKPLAAILEELDAIKNGWRPDL